MIDSPENRCEPAVVTTKASRLNNHSLADTLFAGGALAPSREERRPRRKSSIITWAIALTAIATAVAGIVLTWQALVTSPTFEAAPLPTATFNVPDPAPLTPGVAPGTEPATPAATVRDLRQMKPNTLYLPSQGVFAPVSPRGWDGDDMSLPKDPTIVGWSDASVPPGASEGISLYSGHVNYAGKRGALWNLTTVHPGDMAYVADRDGTIYPFVATAIDLYQKVPVSTLPGSLFATTGAHRMVIVTCAGRVLMVNGHSHYEYNVAVTFAPHGDPIPAAH